MASVDLAFEAVAGRLGADVTYWRLWDQSEWCDPPGGSSEVGEGVVRDETSGLTYRLARGHLEEFLQADALVYWGDFHHMAVYLDQTADVLHRRMSVGSREEASAIAADFLMLRGQPREVLSRAVTFGTTLAFNTALDYSGRYGVEFTRLLEGLHGAWFRDGYSARVAELARTPRAASCLGSDAAFVLEGVTQSSAASGVGVFIGRSPVSPETVAKVGKALTEGLGGVPQWIPWGTAPAMWPMWGRKRLRVAWPELERGAPLSRRDRARHLREVVRGPGLKEEVLPAHELFRRIAECRVILTDTYHLAVNAWRIGTPAVLFFDRRASRGWNVNSGAGVGRDKRHDLYSQLDALPLLVDLDAPPVGSAARDLGEAVKELRDPVTARAAAIGERARGLLTDSLESLISI
ncbi:hypothetical protein [Ornithinimicrobium sp. CNJ-824]|uniref:hypothetical protein n=1 Tax=Ornithinimicrobium sp. CNJ-824 TaxID=1904966 RepID=UPI00117CD7A4|nr:hypothetical protein [Ornithinimicrobium sp. CNJ-824]